MPQATGEGSRRTINRNIRTHPWAIYMNLLRVPDESLKAEALRLSSNRTSEQLLQAIERSFKIDDYLELRKRFPDQDTACWMVMANDKASPSWGMDFAFQLETDFEKFGISIHGFLGTLDGAPEDIDRFALEILAAISDREKRIRENPHAVSAGHAIGDTLLDFSICTILEALAYYGDSPPDSFQILVKARLNIFDNSIKEKRVLKLRRMFVAKIMAENSEWSFRQLANATGLNVSTISRWAADPDFASYVEMFRQGPLKLPKD